MPTGYTYGIIDGNIKTLEEFGKVCMRAFLIHMRDDPNNKGYYEIKPSNYNKKELKIAMEELKISKELSDTSIVNRRKRELNKDIKYHLKGVEETNKANKVLNSLLEKAKEYKAPTKEHIGIKNFMIEQLESTIDHDGSSRYHDEALPKLYLELKNIDATIIRCNRIEQAKKDIKYHLKHHREDLKRCAETNKWVSDFIKAFKP